jgi:hypothetical protein
MAALSAIAFGTGCLSSSKASNEQDQEQRQEADLNAEEMADDEEVDFEKQKDDEALGPPHPQKITAYHTRILIDTVAQPKAEDVRRCIETLSALTKEATNEDDLLILPQQLDGPIKDNPHLYHFCFYQVVARLDQRLDEGGPLIEELSDIFLETMKGLWMLATALDLNYGYTDSGKYLFYLKNRYMQMSKDYFGRALTTITIPNNKLIQKPTAEGKRFGKPAAEFDEDD